MKAAKEAKIIMYGTEYCPYCMAARLLLKKKGAEYTDLMIGADQERRAEMQRLSGRTSVPQIFINDEHIGGFDDLCALDQKGDLDPLLDISVSAAEE